MRETATETSSPLSFFLVLIINVTSPDACAAARCGRCMAHPNPWPDPVHLRKQAAGSFSGGR